MRFFIFSFAIGYGFIKGAKGIVMSSPFSIPGWNISEIKNPNGTREAICHKQKNVSGKSKSFFRALLKTLIILPLLTFTVIFITNKHTLIKNYFSTFANNINSFNKHTTITAENNNIANKEVITVNKTVAEEKPKVTQPKNVVEQKAKQPVIVPVVIRDYSENKPWEAFNIIKADLKTTDNKEVLYALFDYLCSFNNNSTANNQGLAAVWKNKCGTDKTVAELFSYVVNSGSSLKCYTVKRNSEYWNEVNIAGATIVYDISNNKVTSNNSDYQNGYKY